MADRLLELGQGLEIWRASAAEIREQDVNARVMEAAMFSRLTATVKRDQRLESLPFCVAVFGEIGEGTFTAVTTLGEKTVVSLEIISGHHRIRSGLAAGLTEFYLLVDVTGLSRDTIMAKQLAHNSIQGKDDPQILAKIFTEIQDAEARLEAFISQDIQLNIPKVTIQDIDVAIDYKSVLVVFLPHEKDRFEAIAKEVAGRYAGIYTAEIEMFEPFKVAANRISSEYEIRSMGTILAKMADIVAEALEMPVEEGERVSLRDIFKTNMIPAEAAAVIKAAVAKMIKAGEVSDKAPWQFIEFLAADYNSKL